MLFLAQIATPLPILINVLSGAVSCKIVTILKLLYLVNGIDRVLTLKMQIWGNTRSLICNLDGSRPAEERHCMRCGSICIYKPAGRAGNRDDDFGNVMVRHR